MNELEQETTDAKAGWSSWCRRGEHRSCSAMGARCTNPRHGPRGQRPPQPPSPVPAQRRSAPTVNRQEKLMADLQVVPPPSSEDSHTCDQCGRVFGRAQALAVHKRRSHGTIPAPKPAKRATARPAAAAKVPAVADPWLVVVRDDTTSYVATFGTQADAEEATRLAHLLTGRDDTMRFRVADGHG